MNLVGTYECRVDAKARLMLPSSLKKQLDAVLKQEFVLKKSLHEKCLVLYPISEWNEETKEFKSMFTGINKHLKETQDFIRKFSSGYKTVELDTVGRLLIPKDLLSFSGIKNDVVVVGMGSFLEIWSKPEHEKFEKSTDFNVLVKKITKNKE